MGKVKAKKAVRELKSLRRSEQQKKGVLIDRGGRCCRCCRCCRCW
jgi:hypothetical protein